LFGEEFWGGQYVGVKMDDRGGSSESGEGAYRTVTAFARPARLADWS